MLSNANDEATAQHFKKAYFSFRKINEDLLNAQTASLQSASGVKSRMHCGNDAAGDACRSSLFDMMELLVGDYGEETKDDKATVDMIADVGREYALASFQKDPVVTNQDPDLASKLAALFENTFVLFYQMNQLQKCRESKKAK